MQAAENGHQRHSHLGQVVNVIMGKSLTSRFRSRMSLRMAVNVLRRDLELED